MKKPPFFLSVSSWITGADRPIKHGPQSRRAVMIPLLIMQYGSIKAKMKSFATLKHYFVQSIKSMRESAKNITQNPKTGIKSIDAQTLQELESFAKELGVSSIGYTKVNPNFIFKDFEILYDSAMMLTMEMNKQLIDTSPSQACNQEIFRTYAALGIAVNKIADFLRDRGYNCHPSPAIGGDINTVPTAQDAKLGCIGKNGIVVTPEFGPCVRLAAVFIDVDNLPFTEDNEHLWIADFCEKCKRCVRKCPGAAIYSEAQFLDDGSRIYIDREKCAPYFSEGCSVCISSCVFTGGHYDEIKDGYFRKLSHEHSEK
jgi:ferredoxin